MDQPLCAWIHQPRSKLTWALFQHLSDDEYLVTSWRGGMVTYRERLTPAAARSMWENFAQHGWQREIPTFLVVSALLDRMIRGRARDGSNR